MDIPGLISDYSSSDDDCSDEAGSNNLNSSSNAAVAKPDESKIKLPLTKPVDTKKDANAVPLDHSKENCALAKKYLVSYPSLDDRRVHLDCAALYLVSPVLYDFNPPHRQSLPKSTFRAINDWMGKHFSDGDYCWIERTQTLDCLVDHVAAVEDYMEHPSESVRRQAMAAVLETVHKVETCYSLAERITLLAEDLSTALTVYSDSLDLLSYILTPGKTIDMPKAIMRLLTYKSLQTFVHIEEKDNKIACLLFITCACIIRYATSKDTISNQELRKALFGEVKPIDERKCVAKSKSMKRKISIITEAIVENPFSINLFHCRAGLLAYMPFPERFRILLDLFRVYKLRAKFQEELSPNVDLDKLFSEIDFKGVLVGPDPNKGFYQLSCKAVVHMKSAYVDWEAMKKDVILLNALEHLRGREFPDYSKSTEWGSVSRHHDAPLAASTFPDEFGDKVLTNGHLPNFGNPGGRDRSRGDSEASSYSTISTVSSNSSISPDAQMMKRKKTPSGSSTNRTGSSAGDNKLKNSRDTSSNRTTSSARDIKLKQRSSEIDKKLTDGSTALLREPPKCEIAFQCYESALEMILKEEDESDCSREIMMIRFLLSEAYIKNPLAKSDHYNRALAHLEQIGLLVDAGARFPLLYYGKAQYYYYLHQFADALNELESAQTILANKIPIEKQYYPGTSILYTNSTKDAYKIVIEDLFYECKHPAKYDVVCKRIGCAQTGMYFSDIHFQGYIRVKCSTACNMNLHLECWKLILTEVYKLSCDKDTLMMHCFTPDCDGKLIEISIYKADSTLKTKVSMKPEKSADMGIKTASKKHQVKKIQKSLKSQRGPLESLTDNVSGGQINQNGSSIEEKEGNSRRTRRPWNTGNRGSRSRSRAKSESNPDSLEGNSFAGEEDTLDYGKAEGGEQPSTSRGGMIQSAPKLVPNLNQPTVHLKRDEIDEGDFATGTGAKGKKGNKKKKTNREKNQALTLDELLGPNRPKYSEGPSSTTAFLGAIEEPVPKRPEKQINPAVSSFIDTLFSYLNQSRDFIEFSDTLLLNELQDNVEFMQFFDDCDGSWYTVFRRFPDKFFVKDNNVCSLKNRAKLESILENRNNLLNSYNAMFASDSSGITSQLTNHDIEFPDRLSSAANNHASSINTNKASVAAAFPQLVPSAEVPSPSGYQNPAPVFSSVTQLLKGQTSSQAAGSTDSVDTLGETGVKKPKFNAVLKPKLSSGVPSCGAGGIQANSPVRLLDSHSFPSQSVNSNYVPHNLEQLGDTGLNLRSSALPHRMVTPEKTIFRNNIPSSGIPLETLRQKPPFGERGLSPTSDHSAQSLCTDSPRSYASSNRSSPSAVVDPINWANEGAKASMHNTMASKVSNSHEFVLQNNFNSNPNHSPANQLNKMLVGGVGIEDSSSRFGGYTIPMLERLERSPASNTDPNTNLPLSQMGPVAGRACELSAMPNQTCVDAGAAKISSAKNQKKSPLEDIIEQLLTVTQKIGIDTDRRFILKCIKSYREKEGDNFRAIKRSKIVDDIFMQIQKERKPVPKVSDVPAEVETCCICLASLQNPLASVTEALCHHRFHNDCLNTWLKVKRTCPLCQLFLVDQNEFPSL